MIEETQNESNDSKIEFSPASSSNVVKFETSKSEQPESRLLDQASQNMVNSVNYFYSLTSDQIENSTDKLYTKSEEINHERGDNMQMDTYFKEIKEDMREREGRNEKRFSDLANFTEKRDKQLRDELKEREERFRDESKEREDRFMKSVDELKNEFKETKADNKSTKNAIWTLSISTILAIAAMVVAIIIAM